MRKCVSKISDEGNFSTTHITMSPDGQSLATASKMGVVNFFKFDSNQQKLNPSPLKSVMNLTTAITDIKFNPTS